MKITKYILEILQQKESIILPGFGEFRTITKNPEVQDDGVITAPGKSLSFNSTVKANDYFLARLVAEKENITISQGNEQIKDFVDSLLQELDKSGTLTLKGIGVFAADSYNALSFTPDPDTFIDISTFGLEDTSIPVQDEPQIQSESQYSNAHSEPIEEEPLMPEEQAQGVVEIHEPVFDQVHDDENIETTDVAPEVTLETPEITNKETVEKPVEEGDEDVERPKKRRKWWLWLLLFIVLVLTAGVYVALNRPEYTESIKSYISEKLIPKQSTPQPVEPGDGAIDVDNTEIESEAPVDEELSDIEGSEEEEGEFPEHNDDASAIDSYVQDGDYIIVAGCFGIEANANKMVTMLQNEGFTNAEIKGKTATGLFRVVAGTFDSKDEADKALSAARSENKLKNGWVGKK